MVTDKVYLAEDPNFLTLTRVIPFTSEPIEYTFTDSGVGQKLLYVKFISNIGTEQNALPFPAEIRLENPAPTPTPDPGISISSTNLDVTVNRSNPNPFGIPFAQDVVLGQGLTVTSSPNAQLMTWVVESQRQTEGFGLWTSASGIAPGQTQTTYLYIDAAKPNGVYTSSAVIKYNDSQGRLIAVGPTINYKITLEGTELPFSVDRSVVNDTLRRSVSTLGRGITITNKTSSTVGITITIKNGPSGIGLRPISSAVIPGRPLIIESFIDRLKPNGVYTGENLIMYSVTNGIYLDGPTIPYTITFTD